MENLDADRWDMNEADIQESSIIREETARGEFRDVELRIFYKCRFCKTIFSDKRVIPAKIEGEYMSLPKFELETKVFIGRRGHYCDKGHLESPDALIHGICDPVYVEIVSSGRVYFE